MYLTLISLVFFNFGIKEVLIHDKLNFVNQANSPLNEMEGMITAYNKTYPIYLHPFDGRLDFLQRICKIKQMPNFNHLNIWPMPGTWNSNCNLTSYDSIKEMYYKDGDIVGIRFVLYSSIILLCIISISWSIKTFKIKSSRCSDSEHLIFLFAIPPYLLSTISILISFAGLFNLSSKTDNLIPGANYYTYNHFIILLIFYLLMNILLLSNFMISLIDTCKKQREEEL